MDIEVCWKPKDTLCDGQYSSLHGFEELLDGTGDLFGDQCDTLNVDSWRSSETSPEELTVAGDEDGQRFEFFQGPMSIFRTTDTFSVDKSVNSDIMSFDTVLSSSPSGSNVDVYGSAINGTLCSATSTVMQTSDVEHPFAENASLKSGDSFPLFSGEQGHSSLFESLSVTGSNGLDVAVPSPLPSMENSSLNGMEIFSEIDYEVMESDISLGENVEVTPNSSKDIQYFCTQSDNTGDDDADYYRDPEVLKSVAMINSAQCSKTLCQLMIESEENRSCDRPLSNGSTASSGVEVDNTLLSSAPSGCGSTRYAQEESDDVVMCTVRERHGRAMAQPHYGVGQRRRLLTGDVKSVEVRIRTHCQKLILSSLAARTSAASNEKQSEFSTTVMPDHAKEALAHDHGYFSMCPSPCRADVLVHVIGGNERSLSTLMARTTQSHQHRLHGTVCTARTSRKNSKALHKLSSIHPLHFMSDTTPYSRTQKFKDMNCRDKEKKAKHRSTEKDRRNASKLILEHLLSSILHVPGNYLQTHSKFSKSKQVAPKIAILMSAGLTHYNQIKKIRCICNKILPMAPGLKKHLDLSGLPGDLQKLEGFVLECDGVLDRKPDLKYPHLLEAIYKG